MGQGNRPEISYMGHHGSTALQRAYYILVVAVAAVAAVVMMISSSLVTFSYTWFLHTLMFIFCFVLHYFFSTSLSELFPTYI